MRSPAKRQGIKMCMEHMLGHEARCFFIGNPTHDQSCDTNTLALSSVCIICYCFLFKPRTSCGFLISHNFSFFSYFSLRWSFEATRTLMVVKVHV